MNRKGNGQFLKGEHWRTPQAFRRKDWLIEHYVKQSLSTGDIAKMFNVTKGAITFWLRRHDIPRRSTSEARKVKHWGAMGKDNPMFGKTGEMNPNWKGGVSPKRNRVYSRHNWKTIYSKVLERDKKHCRRCNEKIDYSVAKSFHVHHITPFQNGEAQSDFDINNLILLCDECHIFVHSKRNAENEYLQKRIFGQPKQLTLEGIL